MQPFKNGQMVGPPEPFDQDKAEMMIASGEADVVEIFAAKMSAERQARYEEQERSRRSIEALAKQHTQKCK